MFCCDYQVMLSDMMLGLPSMSPHHMNNNNSPNSSNNNNNGKLEGNGSCQQNGPQHQHSGLGPPGLHHYHQEQTSATPSGCTAGSDPGAGLGAGLSHKSSTGDSHHQQGESLPRHNKSTFENKFFKNVAMTTRAIAAGCNVRVNKISFEVHRKRNNGL